MALDFSFFFFFLFFFFLFFFFSSLLLLLQGREGGKEGRRVFVVTHRIYIYI